MLIAMLSLLILCTAKAHDEPETPLRSNESDLFRPSLWKPAWMDQDNNGIADGLDKEIADRLANRTAKEYVNVIVMLKSAPTPYDADTFASSGGYVTTSPWTEAIYGFGGRIPYDAIVDFARQCSDVLLVEEDAVCNASLAYAATQVGARPYVWNTLGLQGDPNSSIAILDTGIDASHPDFSPGFGDQDFSKKVVGWDNQVNGTATPFDDNGHGSHCAGLATGDGFFSVDGSGNAITTWGADLGSVSSTATYFISGMMVNKTGTITINVKWATTGTAKLSALPLYYGDKAISPSSWTQVASVSTPSQNTWYPLNYNIASTPSGGYDMYHVLMTLTAGTGNLYVTFTMSWPYTPPTDGFSAWTGIAPQAKLVGVKVLDYSGSGSSTGLINGMDWIIANRITYHITVASMSLGFGSEVGTVDSAVVNLVNSGITTIVAAGNSGSGSNYIYTPGSVDEVITVAAMNQFDNIASYSSQGGTSRYTGETTKPDITAPGGSFYGVPLFSADSNNGDAEGKWPDVQANDSAPMQGTSMATPVVAGATDIVIQAMGGYVNWNWTRSQALQPKMILLMTATETYPNLRESSTTTYSPTLNRGGKDVHEGYGRLNLDAAVDAVLKTYQIGTNATDTLGMPPTLSDISVLGQRLAWARNVQLVSGFKYNFTLSVPAGADYDLYLYNSTGTTYGEPAIVAKSTTATTGGTETLSVTAPYTGTYYIVVKRATETTGSGAFNLTSSGPVSVTLDTPGLASASNVVHYVQSGASKNGSIANRTFSDYADTGTTLQIDNPIYVSAVQRFTTTDPTSFGIQQSTTFTVSYTLQYDVTFNQTGVGTDFTSTVVTVDGTDYNSSGASFWWYNQSFHSFVFYSPLGVTVNEKQYAWNNSNGLSTEQSDSVFQVTSSGSITGNYLAQYYINVTSAHDLPTTSQWVDQGGSTTVSVTSPADDNGAGTRYRCTGYTLDSNPPTTDGSTSYNLENVQNTHTISFNWISQYQLYISTDPTGLSPQPIRNPLGQAGPTNGWWYDASTSVTVTAQASSGYMFDHWNVDGASQGNGVNPIMISMGGSHTATPHYLGDAYLVVRGAHDEIFYRIYNSSTASWGSWSGLPEGATIDSPAAVMCGNELHVVVRGINYDQIWHCYVNLTDGSFSGWTLLSGSTSSTPTLTANSTTLCLVVRGETNAVYYRFCDVASKVWGDWTAVPLGTTYTSPAAALVNDTLQVVVRGINYDQIWHCFVNLADSSFSGWTLLSGATPSAPTLATNDTTLCLVVRGETNVVYYRFYDLTSHTWNGWIPFPSYATPDNPASGGTTDSPAAILLNGTLQVVVRGVNDDQIWHGYVNLTDNTFSGWIQLSGSTPSKPTLTS